jgi:hypothetical protein
MFQWGVLRTTRAVPVQHRAMVLQHDYQCDTLVAFHPYSSQQTLAAQSNSYCVSRSGGHLAGTIRSSSF